MARFREKPVARLSAAQRRFLQGLTTTERWLVMSAYELGHTDVSELQATGLVDIRDLLDGKNWRITPTGRAALAKEHE